MHTSTYFININNLTFKVIELFMQFPVTHLPETTRRNLTILVKITK